jgi:hypothetical protein
VKYEKALQAGKYVWIVHGTRDETQRAQALLDLTQHQSLTAHIS